MKRMTQLQAGRRYLIVLLAALAPVPVLGASGGAAPITVRPPKPVTQPAALDQDRALDAALRAPENEDRSVRPLERLVDRLCRASGRNFIVLGKLRVTEEEVRALEGKPAREAMQDLATRLTPAQGPPAEWHRYRAFYLLFPPSMLRHGATPRSLSRQYPVLRREVSATIGGTMYGVVRLAGQKCHTVLLVAPVGASPEEANRMILPCVLSAREATLDEVMMALTALTGDPWERLEEALLLSLSGRLLTAEGRESMARAVVSVRFTQSLTDRQMAQIQERDGLRAQELEPQQRQWLETATRQMREYHGGGVEDLVLRRLPSGPGAFGSDVRIYRDGPTGRRAIGALSLY